jgi:hypothetical protein
VRGEGREGKGREGKEGREGREGMGWNKNLFRKLGADKGVAIHATARHLT